MYAGSSQPAKWCSVNYEVRHGNQTHFVGAGNQYAACLDALRLELEEGYEVYAPFEVTPIPNGECETIPMALVLKIQLMALNPDDVTLYDDWGATPMDLNHW